MTKSFIAKVLKKLTVDTKNYRYNVEYIKNVRTIKRLPLSSLDTADALSGWETVWTEA